MEPTTNTVERETLTLTELAERLGLSMTSAYVLANKDQLPIPAMRVGRRFLFSRRALDEVLQRQHDVTSDHAA